MWPFKKKTNAPQPWPTSAGQALGSDPDPYFWLSKGLATADPVQIRDWESMLRRSAREAQDNLEQFLEGQKARALVEHARVHAPEVLTEFERVHEVRRTLAGKRP